MECCGHIDTSLEGMLKAHFTERMLKAHFTERMLKAHKVAEAEDRVGWSNKFLIDVMLTILRTQSVEIGYGPRLIRLTLTSWQ